MIARFFFLCFLLSSTVEGFSSPPAEAIIRLVDKISVRAPVVTLGEIASIESENDALRTQLLQLPVGDVPRVGSSRIISSFKIKSILQNEGLSNVKVYGIQSTVEVETRLVDEEEIREMVRDWVSENINKDVDAEVTFSILPKNWLVPLGSGVIIDVEPPKKKRLAGSVYLNVRATADGRVISSGRTRVKIALYKKVAVAIRPVKKGERIEAKHVEIRRADVTTSKGMEAQALEDILGMVAKRDLNLGKIISVNDCTRPVVIERGSLNRIFVLNGHVRLSISGAEALQSGKKDQLIIFSNPMNKKETLKARVVRAGVAMIKLK